MILSYRGLHTSETQIAPTQHKQGLYILTETINLIFCQLQEDRVRHLPFKHGPSEIFL